MFHQKFLKAIYNRLVDIDKKVVIQRLKLERQRKELEKQYEQIKKLIGD